jgi:hypothetical protein
MATRKKQTQTFHYYNYGNKKKTSPPRPPTMLVTSQKKDSYWIPFIINVINDCHNNSNVVKGR